MTLIFRRVHKSIMHTLLFEAGRVRCRQNCPTCRRGFPCPEYEARYYHVVSAAAYEQLDYTYACDRFRPQDLYIESQLLARVVMLAMESATNEVRICEIRFQDCHRCQTQASASVRKKIMDQLFELRQRYRLITTQERHQLAERERLGRQNGHGIEAMNEREE